MAASDSALEAEWLPPGAIVALGACGRPGCNQVGWARGVYRVVRVLAEGRHVSTLENQLDEVFVWCPEHGLHHEHHIAERMWNDVGKFMEDRLMYDLTHDEYSITGKLSPWSAEPRDMAWKFDRG